eukprot:TRINITY_DN17616_c0_g1_i1.p1 TRINITY_DN17616_c0_g1~~TRINITY_DN17616_c0_g1_i1.p1  ORF type:complete len:121 (-),score=17.36 TRINITY_DN17616_c0_g1_i1:157-474(-)
MLAEYCRLGIPNQRWRITEINNDHELIPSYPALFAVPTSVDDACLRKVAQFRTRQRIPALCWVHPTLGSSLSRSSQPRRGVTGSTNEKDEMFLEILASYSNSSSA